MTDRPRTRRAAEARRRAAARRRRRLAAAAAAIGGLGAIVGLVALTAGSATDEGRPGGEVLGADVFAASCATCHGPDLRGTFVGPPLLDDLYAPDHHDDDAVRSAIANGVQPHHWDFAAMPPLPDLDAAEVEAVIAHIRAAQQAAGIGEGAAAP